MKNSYYLLFFTFLLFGCCEKEETIEAKLYLELSKNIDIHESLYNYDDLKLSRVIQKEYRTKDFIYITHQASLSKIHNFFYSIKLEKMYKTVKINLPHGQPGFIGKNNLDGFIQYLNDNSTKNIFNVVSFFESFFNFFYRTKAKVLKFDYSKMIKVKPSNEMILIFLPTTQDTLILDFTKNNEKYIKVKYYFPK